MIALISVSHALTPLISWPTQAEDPLVGLHSQALAPGKQDPSTPNWSLLASPAVPAQLLLPRVVAWWFLNLHILALENFAANPSTIYLVHPWDLECQPRHPEHSIASQKTLTFACASIPAVPQFQEPRSKGRILCQSFGQFHTLAPRADHFEFVTALHYDRLHSPPASRFDSFVDLKHNLPHLGSQIGFLPKSNTTRFLINWAIASLPSPPASLFL